MTMDKTGIDEEIAGLKREYQSVSAPPFLATRIKAETSSARSRRSVLWPAFGFLAVVLALFVALPFMNREPAVTVAQAVPKMPSLSAITRAMPDKPAVPAPSLARIRSVKVPAMPAKPGSKPVRKTKDSNETTGQIDWPKELTDEVV